MPIWLSEVVGDVSHSTERPAIRLLDDDGDGFSLEIEVPDKRVYLGADDVDLLIGYLVNWRNTCAGRTGPTWHLLSDSKP